jgi:hypothetical protein
LRSVALPASEGKRRIFSSVPAALFSASTWFDQYVCIAPVPTASVDWSSDLLNSSLICQGEQMAPAFCALTS